MADEAKNDGDEPVYPHLHASSQRVNETEHYDGITLRRHAAIELKVPDSGLEWLDEMIEKRNFADFAGQALIGILSSMPYDKDDAGTARSSIDIVEVQHQVRAGGHEARTAFDYAAAMIAEKRRREA